MKRTVINVSGEAHALLKEHCDQEGLKIGHFADQLIFEHFGVIAKTKTKAKIKKQKAK